MSTPRRPDAGVPQLARPAPDAHIIHSDGLTPEQIADEIVRIMDARKRGHDA